MRPTSTILLLALPLALCHETNNPPTLIVSYFSAFVSKTDSITSHVSFQVLDPRPDHFLNLTCVYAPTQNNERPNTIYGDGWRDCDAKLAWWLTEDFFALQRTWYEELGNTRTWIIGVTDKQDPHWSEARIGACANVTSTFAGRYYSRTTDWEFPIHTIMS